MALDRRLFFVLVKQDKKYKTEFWQPGLYNKLSQYTLLISTAKEMRCELT